MITIDKGESKALNFVLTGDVSTDHTRITIETKAGVEVDKFSTDAGDTEYTTFYSVAYDGPTDMTTLVAHVEASVSAAYAAGTHDVRVWTSKAQAGFTEGFIRRSKLAGAVLVQ